jgi:hypothetical protein
MRKKNSLQVLSEVSKKSSRFAIFYHLNDFLRVYQSNAKLNYMCF